MDRVSWPQGQQEKPLTMTLGLETCRLLPSVAIHSTLDCSVPVILYWILSFSLPVGGGDLSMEERALAWESGVWVFNPGSRIASVTLGRFLCVGLNVLMLVSSPHPLLLCDTRMCKHGGPAGRVSVPKLISHLPLSSTSRCTPCTHTDFQVFGTLQD